jgi:peptidyl-prolyl cis-trans isomerase SurA
MIGSFAMSIKISYLKKTLLAVAGCLLFATALRADNIVDEIIARVGDFIITRADYEKGKSTQIDELKERFPSNWQSKWAEKQKDVLRELIDQQLLLDKGKDEGITGEVETTKRLDEIRKSMSLTSMEDLQKAAEQQGVSYEDFKERIRIGIVTQQVISREVGSKIHITAEEVQTWYQQHQQDLSVPEHVKLAEILISTQPPKPAAEKGKDQAALPMPLNEDPVIAAQAEKHAKDVLEQLRKGAKFEELAKKESNGPTAAQGGDLGSFGRGELAKELEQKTFALKTGEYTDVIRTKQGYIIFKVVEHQNAGVPPVKEVDEKIRELIYSQKLEPSLRAFLTRLREESYIDIRAGYSDTGASPHQSKPIIVAANGSGDEIKATKAKKKKKFGVF